MKYKIVQIIDDDYGCEGIPEGQEPMCSVLVRNDNSEERWIKLSDSYLRKNNINEGDTAELED